MRDHEGMGRASERHDLPAWLTRAAAILGFGLAAIVCAMLGVVPVIASVRALSLHMPVVIAHPRGGVTFSLTIALVCFAAMSALPDLQIRVRPSRRSTTARKANRAADVLFTIAAAAALTVPIAPIATLLLLKLVAAQHGYEACPPLLSGRYGKVAWALNAHHCPNAG